MTPGVAIGITFGVLGVVVAVLFVIFRHRIAAWYHARADSKGFRPADEFSTLVSPAGPAKKLPRFMQRGNNFTKLDEEEPMHELPNYGQ
ncbi:hypothetical protein HDU83_008089 [Entophlyctis luteolus]|nr:hypothetical protein HDU83_008089 [Entophlyctis luteolus]KAJ3394416.1 hypothetical protein HDU84_008412 [Entophlyctis sp. JEL0112]